MNVMKKTFEIRSCIETLTNDNKIYKIYQYMFYS